MTTSLWKYALIFIPAILCMLSAPVLTEASEGKNFPPVILDFSGSGELSRAPSPWKLRINEGAADTRVVVETGEPALYLHSRSSSFSLEREVVLDAKEYPFLSWTWKALTIPPRGDIRMRSRNDQVLQILVAFEGGRIISYVWDSNAPAETVADESIGIPLFIAVKVIVVKSGISDTRRWLTVNRNLYDDYRMLFNREPGRVRGIRIQTNSQYTGGCAEGMLKRIVFRHDE